MRFFGVWLVVVLSVFARQSLWAAQYILAEESEAKAVIVLRPEATLAEKSAANELALYLQQITSAKFSVLSASEVKGDSCRIYVGQSDTAKKMLGIASWDQLKPDGIAIRFVGADIVLAGDRPRGSLYAVYTFLEQYCGCRWWTPSASTIPTKKNLSVQGKDLTHIPPFLYREIYHASIRYANPEQAVRLKINGYFQPIPEELGGHIDILGFCHTFAMLLPASTYFEQHPEWFAMVNGKRLADNTQPCLTNMQMKDEMVKNALKWVDENPLAGIISISQTDGGIPCQCENCRRVIEEEGSESGPLIRFVNAVAEDIDKKHPGFLVDTLAYVYSRKPPKHVRPRENVIVRLCSIEGDFSKPLNSETNTAFFDDLQSWGKITDKLFVWDYVVNFWNGLIVFPNWHVLGPNIRLFRDNKVIGLFEQGDGFNISANFGFMKTWVLAKLMWDPSLDAHKLMEEFARGYYGKAGPHLMKYLDAACEVVVREDSVMSAFNRGSLSFLAQEDMDYFSRCFDDAEQAVAGDLVLLERVVEERRVLDHMWLLQPFYDRSKAFGKRAPDLTKIAQDFIQYAVSTGNDFVVEGEKMTEDYKSTLLRLAQMPPMPKGSAQVTPPQKAAPLPANSWTDYQEEQYVSARPGFYVFTQEDPDASDKRAVYMPASHKEWAVQLPLRRIKGMQNSRLNIWVSVKAVSKAKTGKAFEVGMVNTYTGAVPYRQLINIEDISGSGYIEYDLGTYDYDPHLIAWVAPCANPEDMDSVWVDRFFVVRE